MLKLIDKIYNFTLKFFAYLDLFLGEKKKSADTKKHAKLPGMQRAKDKNLLENYVGGKRFMRVNQHKISLSHKHFT